MDPKHKALSDPDARVRALRNRVESTRNDLDRFVTELDRRRREALDLRLQARRHPAAAVAVAVGVAGLVAGGAYAAVRATKRARARKARTIVDRIADAVQMLGAGEAPAWRKPETSRPAVLVARVARAVAPALGAILARQAAAFLTDRISRRPRHA